MNVPEYIPPTKSIRNAYGLGSENPDSAFAAFDRWLTEHDRKVTAAALASTPSPAQPTEHEHAWTVSSVVNGDTYYECVPCGAEGIDIQPHGDASRIEVFQEGFRLAPSPVQGADDRLAQAEAVIAAALSLPPSPTLRWAGEMRHVLATYQQSPQAVLNEVRAGSDPESDLFNVTGKLMAANEQIARGNKFVEDSQYLWRTHRPEVFHSLMRRLIKEYEQAGDTE